MNIIAIKRIANLIFISNISHNITKYIKNNKWFVPIDLLNNFNISFPQALAIHKFIREKGKLKEENIESLLK